MFFALRLPLFSLFSSLATFRCSKKAAGRLSRPPLFTGGFSRGGIQFNCRRTNFFTAVVYRSRMHAIELGTAAGCDSVIGSGGAGNRSPRASHSVRLLQRASLPDKN